jgi:hypothetical protein
MPYGRWLFEIAYRCAAARFREMLADTGAGLLVGGAWIRNETLAEIIGINRLGSRGRLIQARPISS